MVSYLKTTPCTTLPMLQRMHPRITPFTVRVATPAKHSAPKKTETTNMALSLLFLASLALTCLPLSRSYRDGARSESCYNMVVIHINGFTGQAAPHMACGSSCQFQLRMVGRVVGENNLTVEEEGSTTYQCGEVYQLQLASTTTATFEGFMVEARENTSSFEEGSTIWGTWVTDSNNRYHAVECNRSNSSSEGPFESAATQSSPDDLTSLNLYWRAPPPPNTDDELLQLPEEIKFWFVAVQQRLTYFVPIEGPVLERSCSLPVSPSPTPSLMFSSPTSSPTYTPQPTDSPPMISSPPPRPVSTSTPPTSSYTSSSSSSSSSSTSSPSDLGLSRVAFIGLVVGAGLGGLLLITLVIVMVAACVYYFVRKRKKQGSHKYGGKKGKKHKNRNLYDAY